MKKTEMIKRILEHKENLTSFFNNCNEKNLNKLNSDNLFKQLLLFKNIRLVEIMNKKEAKEFICNCDTCEEIIRKSNKNVLMQLDNTHKWHLLDIE